MPVHPEVLWAQRSSDSIEEKVFYLESISDRQLSYPVERPIRYCQPSRYRQGDSAVSVDPNEY